MIFWNNLFSNQNGFIFLFSSIKEEEVDYKKLVYELNWMSNPKKPVPPEIVRVSIKLFHILQISIGARVIRTIIVWAHVVVYPKIDFRHFLTIFDYFFAKQMWSWTIPGQMWKVLTVTFFHWSSGLGGDSFIDRQRQSRRSSVYIFV